LTQINDNYGFLCSACCFAPLCANSGLLAMSASDEFCRFAAECLKLARTAKDETNQAVFLQMARVWVALARKEETSSDRNVGAEN
jgi:hypothetical protein